jgi:MFS family permease
LGIEARSRALLGENESAETLYREAIERLGRTRVGVELARAHLLYGEWLRRENRHLDAREQLRTAHHMLTAMDVEGFADRAARELLATGETARKRAVETTDRLTAQEAQIARLARDGLSNPEMAASYSSAPHRRIPPAQGLHQARYQLAHPARPRPPQRRRCRAVGLASPAPDRITERDFPDARTAVGAETRAMDFPGCGGASAVRRIALARALSAGVAYAASSALAFSVYDRTRSAFWVSAVLVATVGASGLIAPLGGWLADRCHRRRVMTSSQLAGAALFVALSFATDIRLVVALAIAVAAAQMPFTPAASAAVPSLVMEEQLCWANGLMAGAMNVGMVVGPAAAGLLLSVGGTALVFQINAIALLLSAGFVSTTTGTFGERRQRTWGMRSGAGFVTILHDAQLILLVSTGALTFAAFGIAVVADPPLAAQFGAGPIGYALLTSVYGAGALCGSLLASRRLNACVEGLALVAGTTLLAVSIAAIAILPSFTAIVLIGGVAGLGHGVNAAAWYGLVQRTTKDSVRGRVLGASQAVEQSSAALAMVAGAFLVNELGAQLVYVVPGGILAAAAATATLALGSRTHSSARHTSLVVRKRVDHLGT